MVNWWILIRERFSPAVYLPMILLFVGANSYYGTLMTGQVWRLERFIVVFVLILSFFFRMRLFDEIKDYEVDLKVNPTRPLARGLISFTQVKKMLFFLILLELIVAGFLGLSAFLVHFAAIAYSLLMYEEFFVGDSLRPHLTTYAITHTFVSTLLGLSSAIAMTGASVLQMPLSFFFFFLMNWAFFNLFEFARKTFAPKEERPHVPSYSNIFGCAGAWLLSISQAFLGSLVIHFLYPSKLIVSAFLVYLISTSVYLVYRSEKSARFFRNISGVYLLIHYFFVILILGA